MRFGCSRVLVLVAVAALFGSIQCYATCLIAACGQTPSTGCHHHKSSHKDRVDCTRQYSELTTPESGISAASVPKAATTLPVLTARSTVAFIELVLLLEPHPGAPPRRHSSPAISVLRI